MANGQSAGRKFGRSKRGASMARYNSTRRDLTNKARVAKKHAKERAKKAARMAELYHGTSTPVVTQRGTARAKRREDMTAFKNLRRWNEQKHTVKTLVTVHYTKDKDHVVSKRI